MGGKASSFFLFDPFVSPAKQVDQCQFVFLLSHQSDGNFFFGGEGGGGIFPLCVCLSLYHEGHLGSFGWPEPERAGAG